MPSSGGSGSGEREDGRKKQKKEKGKKSSLADPWRYAAISIECVACNSCDLFNDRGISKKPEKQA